MYKLINTKTGKPIELYYTFDCMNKENGLPSLKSKSFDLGFTDPPWNINYLGAKGSYGGATKSEHFYNDLIENYYEQILNCFKEMKRICKTIILTPGRQNLSMWSDISIWYEIGKIFDRTGMEPKDILLCHKKTSNLFLLQWNSLIHKFLQLFNTPKLTDENKNEIRRMLEYLIENHSKLFKKELFNDLLIHYKRNGTYGSRIGLFNNFDVYLIFGEIHTWFNSNVIEQPASNQFMRERTFKHPSPKNRKVWMNIIKHVKPNSVLDPYMGTALSAYCCLIYDIKFRGYELYEDYYSDWQIRYKDALNEIGNKRMF